MEEFFPIAILMSCCSLWCVWLVGKGLATGKVPMFSRFAEPVSLQESPFAFGGSLGAWAGSALASGAFALMLLRNPDVTGAITLPQPERVTAGRAVGCTRYEPAYALTRPSPRVAPGDGSADAAAVHFFASLVRGDERFREVTAADRWPDGQRPDLPAGPLELVGRVPLAQARALENPARAFLHVPVARSAADARLSDTSEAEQRYGVFDEAVVFTHGGSPGYALLRETADGWRVIGLVASGRPAQAR